MIRVPDVIDVENPLWPELAYERISQWGFVRLRLTHNEASLARELYDSMDAVYHDRPAALQLEIPDDQFDNLDQRSGYVFGRHRQMFEFHCGSASGSAFAGVNMPAASRLLRVATEYCDMCEARCQEALREIAGSGQAPALCRLLYGEEAAGEASRDRSPAPDVVDSMLRAYRYNDDYDTPDEDIDAHFDMGLLTIIPKSTSPGLLVQPPKTREWWSVEEHMEEDEALLLGGMTLARLTGIPALKHGVFTSGKVRFSAPYFQRVASHCLLPSALGHESEVVVQYSRRLRDADNDELRSDGSIVLARRRRRSRSQRSSRSRVAWSHPNRSKDSRSHGRWRSGATRHWAGGYSGGAEDSWNADGRASWSKSGWWHA